MTPVIFINCTVEPYVDDIMGGLKQYETRSRNTLGRFLGERVLLAETGHGRPFVKCSAVIAEIISVHTREAWEEYLEQTWVPVGSEHDWKPDTKVKWLYRLSDVQPVVPFRLGSDCRRHGRVWAEYEGPVCPMDEVTVICYGMKETMPRVEAIDFYTQGVLACEGCERDRYANILSDLLMGRKVCRDERSVYSWEN